MKPRLTVLRHSFFACGALAVAASALAADLEPVAPDAARFFAAPIFDSPALSPDGTNVGFIGQLEGHRKLFRFDLAKGAVHGVYDPGKGEVFRFWWRGNDQVLLAGHGSDGYVYLLQNIATGKTRTIRSLDYLHPSRISTLPGDPNHVVAIRYDGMTRSYFVSRVDLATDRAETLDPRVDDLDHVVVSHHGEVIAKTDFKDKEWTVYWRADGKAAWQSEKGPGPQPQYWPVGYHAQSGQLLVLARDQGDTTALMTLDASTGKRTLLAQNPTRDVSLLFSSGGNSVRTGFAFFHPGEPDEAYFSALHRDLAAKIARSIPEKYRRIVSSSDDGQRHVISAFNPAQPARFYLLDLSAGRLSSLGTQYAPDAVPAIGETRYFQFATRDGVAETGFVVLPDSQRFAAPHPAVLLPLESVGELATEGDTYDRLAQFLAHRGFAVVRLLVRGSSGFGRRFERDGSFRSSDVMLSDYEDGFAYLASETLIDRQRVGLLGSWTGALVGLHVATKTDLFRALVLRDVLFEPSTGLVLGMLSTEGGTLSRMINQAGGEQSSAELVRALRPGNNVRDLHCPTLIVYSYISGASNSANQVRRLFVSNDKPHEWFVQTMKTSGPLGLEEPEAVFATRAAEFLERQLRPQPRAAATPATH
ncbi:MAG: prolyl oligopeptidase family serine peptidase [Opitutae bacterium]|nr:prolyl oligopeptidase family serine peptidase [Opitutae bacterium]